jgi:hypothetical protein
MGECCVSGCSAKDASFGFPPPGPIRKRWCRNVGISSSNKNIDRKGVTLFWIDSGLELLVCWRHFTQDLIKTVKVNQYSVAHTRADLVGPEKFVPTLTLDQAKVRKEEPSPTFRHTRKRQQQATQRVLFEKKKTKKETRKNIRKRFLARTRVRAYRAKKLRTNLENTKEYLEDHLGEDDCLISIDQSSSDEVPSADVISSADGISSADEALSASSEDEASSTKRHMKIDISQFQPPMLQWKKIMLCPNFIVNFYTSFPSAEALRAFYSMMSNNQGLHFWEKMKPTLNSENALLLTLVILRRGYQITETSLMFGIPASTCGRTFSIWLPILSGFLDILLPTPKKEVFESLSKKFPKTSYSNATHIIDTSAVPIQKPSRLAAQSATYSTYYNCNCVKFLVGMSTTGYVSFVSQGYPGRISDSNICTGFIEFLKNTYSDARVMADRGFYIYFNLSTVGATLLMPARGQAKEKKFSEDQVFHTKKIANERIFIEHVVGALKQFKFLDQTVPLTQVDLIDAALNCSAKLVNLIRGPFVPMENKIFASQPCAAETVFNPALYESAQAQRTSDADPEVESDQEPT